MSETKYGCSLPDCGKSFQKPSDLKRHLVEHIDLSKVLHSPLPLPASEHFTIHLNSHPASRPFACPDMRKVVNLDPSTAPGDPPQLVVSEVPCEYRSSSNSMLIRHRQQCHGYIADQTRSRYFGASPSGANPKLKESTSGTEKSIRGTQRLARGSSFAPLQNPTPGECQAPAPTVSMHNPVSANPSVNSLSPPAAQSSGNGYHPAPNAVAGPVGDHAPQASGAPVVPNSMAMPQNNNPNHGVGSLPFPAYANSFAAMPFMNSLHYTANNTAVGTHPGIQVSSELPYNVMPFSFGQPMPVPAPAIAGATLAYSGPSGPYLPNTYNALPPPLYAVSPAYFNAFIESKVANRDPCILAQESTNASSTSTGQSNRASQDATTAPLPSPQTAPPTVLRQNSESTLVTNGPIIASPDVLFDPTASRSSKEPKTAEVAESAEQSSTESCTPNFGSDDPTPRSRLSTPPSSVDPLIDEADSLFDDPSGGDECTQVDTSEPRAVEPGTDVDPAIAPRNNPAGCIIALPGPSAVLATQPTPTLPAPLADDDPVSDAADAMPSLSDFNTSFDEDDLFYRGTGREGCLCPEMMVKAAVEGWDESLLETHKEYYARSFFG